MIAVTGATGQLGHLVIGELRSKVPVSEIVALARTPAKAADLGITVREADYDRPATLESALKGVDTLLLISANVPGKRKTQHQNVIEAAKKAGVKRIVYTSLLHADTSPLSLADEHVATERALKASGIPFTILRNGWYTENYIGSIASALATGAVLGSAGAGRISSAARADYAKAAVAVLTSAGHEGKTYELAGDQSWTLGDLAAEISRQSRTTIRYDDLPEAEYEAVLEKVGLPDVVARTIAGYDVATSKDALFDDSRQLSALIGPTTPLSDVVGTVLKSAAATEKTP